MTLPARDSGRSPSAPPEASLGTTASGADATAATSLWRAGLATLLIFLLAVPHQTFWQDYETARRGLLAILCGLLCLFPRVVPRRVPASVWAINLLALWLLARSLFDVTSRGHAMEIAAHYLAIAVLVIIGTGLTLRHVLLAAIPTGLVVGGVTYLQQIGMLQPLPGDHNVTSTLGNLNVASEVLAICGSMAALLASFRPSTVGSPSILRGLGLVTVAVCAGAILINGSRSGLIALPLGCAVALFAGRRALWVLAALLVGFGLGAVTPGPTASTPKPQAVAQATAGTPSTVDVRLQLWRGGLQMVEERWLIGQGTGQFAIEYPRVRTREELELSTFDRRFLASPGTTHNDFLQILIEGGIPALLLLLLAAALVLRRAPLWQWGPILALAALAFVRAPLLNAPAAALAALFAGGLLGHHRRADEREFSFAPSRQMVKGLVFGGIMLWFGATQLFSQIAGAGVLQRIAEDRDPEGQLAGVESALTYRPWDQNFLQLRAQAKLRMNALDEAERDIARLRRERPHDSLTKWLDVELMRSRGRNKDALEALQELRKADPYDPKAIIWTAEILVQLRQSPAAIVLLYSNLQIRNRFAAVLRDLAEFADRRGDRADAQVLRIEQLFIETVDAIRDGNTTKALLKAISFNRNILTTASGRKDLRAILLTAAALQAKGDSDQAKALAVAGRDRSPLPKTHQALLRDVIAKLVEIPEWRDLLAARK